MPVPLEYNSSLRRMSTLTIPKQDINFDTYDFQLCTPQNDIKDTFESKDLEASYCRDFACCGLILNDLHDLLQHYEECHVRLDDDESSLFDSENDSWSSFSFSSFSPEDTASADEPKSDYIDVLKKKAVAYLYDFYKTGSSSTSGSDDDNEDTEKPSAGKKRPHSQISSGGSTSALDILTQSAVKKLALASSLGNGTDFPTSLITNEEFLAQAGAILASANSNMNADKPYKCPVAGCDKAYKNPNGLKYHNQHGHCNLINDDSENLASKPYQCTIGDCGKRYKNLNGLKYHIEHSHMVALNQTLATFGSSLFSLSSLSPSSSSSSSPLSSPSTTSSASSSPMLGAAPITFNLENPTIFPLL
ncbi:hypothetical protein G6F70_002308 [Rhizopus microsporus]|uniref:C2H2-type domain-containing protein n=2 Tax=Rhizopus TaxID=4842 RepID=A0A367JRS5_RHIAZ|nr:hypothetical protein G6F71_002427 [Rhizopus microsporus]RCH92660.1 hypothetical protein CU097_004682 [Rhizopus azygosporus]KAG1202362.1 hypothetical protein G6F70_002308 [Rhizopus microsporus]KAG1214166.1 hypothetical protein G6F69_002150 [Rhizopus microsporus]KAG1236639.1 hypothetical protein G6F67_001817 [Rhizopus microsporus]